MGSALKKSMFSSDDGRHKVCAVRLIYLQARLCEQDSLGTHGLSNPRSPYACNGMLAHGWKHLHQGIIVPALDLATWQVDLFISPLHERVLVVWSGAMVTNEFVALFPGMLIQSYFLLKLRGYCPEPNLHAPHAVKYVVRGHESCSNLQAPDEPECMAMTVSEYLSKRPCSCAGRCADVEVLLLLIWRPEGWSENELDAVGHIGLRFETEWFWKISKIVLHT